MFRQMIQGLDKEEFLLKMILDTGGSALYLWNPVAYSSTFLDLFWTVVEVLSGISAKVISKISSHNNHHL